VLNDIVKGPEGLNGEVQICCSATFPRDRHGVDLVRFLVQRCRMLRDWRLEAIALPERRFASAVDIPLLHV